MRHKLPFLCLSALVASCGGRSRLTFGERVDGTGGFGGEMTGGSAGSGGLGFTGGTDASGGLPAGVGGSGSGGMSGSGGVGATGGVGASGGANGAGGTGGIAATGGGWAAGGAQACDSDNDCTSTDPCWIGECYGQTCYFELRDRDSDGWVDSPCGGLDCNDLNPLAYPYNEEDCVDGSDNDCNGLPDCFDPACQEASACGCQPGSTVELCENGVDDDCDGQLDCFDADCIGTEPCGCVPELCENGIDDDCDGKLDCQDAACEDVESCSCRATQESCSNLLDDDCDGRIDCSDSQCAFSAACLCLVAQVESCVDGRDNDCDGAIDCGDSDCFLSSACSKCVTEVCSGGKDEDCDGLIDCADATCAFDAACQRKPEACNNDRDDDFDGLIDCDDPDCSNISECLLLQNTCLTSRQIPAFLSATYQGDTTGQLSNSVGTCGGAGGEAIFSLTLTEPSRVHLDTRGSSFDTSLYVRWGSCPQGQELACDDDGGGLSWSSAIDFSLLLPGTYFIFVDGLTVDPYFGADEGRYVLTVEVSPAEEVCGDGIDNDGNVYADCADPACAPTDECTNCIGGGRPLAEFGVQLCTDGIDNDCDGDTDCEDDDCAANPALAGECCDGDDDNGNGIEDDFSCRCKASWDCDGNQVCYTRTLGTCAPPCDAFVGEICPFLAPGSYCNQATAQCEF